MESQDQQEQPYVLVNWDRIKMKISDLRDEISWKWDMYWKDSVVRILFVVWMLALPFAVMSGIRLISPGVYRDFNVTVGSWESTFSVFIGLMILASIAANLAVILRIKAYKWIREYGERSEGHVRYQKAFTEKYVNAASFKSCMYFDMSSWLWVISATSLTVALILIV